MRAPVPWIAALAVVCAVEGANAPARATEPGPPVDQLVPVDASDPASGVVIAAWRGGRLAIVADEEDQTLRAFDLVASREVSATKLAGVPGPLLVLPDGRVVVAIRDRGRLQVLRPSAGASDVSLVVERDVVTGGEPVGLALTRDRATLLVTSGWTHELTAVSLADWGAGWRIDLAREPRAIVVSDDGATAFVSHAIGGRISTVNLSTQQVAELAPSANVLDTRGVVRRSVGTQGYALAKSGSTIYAPLVWEDPDRATTYYGASPTALGVVAVDQAGGAVSPESVKVDSRRPALPPGVIVTTPLECMLPRAAVVVRDGRLIVGCAGLSELVVMNTRGTSPAAAQMPRIAVHDWASALAADPSTGVIVSWSQFGRSLSIIAPRGTDGAVVGTMLRASGGAMPDALVRGRRIFHAAGDPRLSFEGRACASCHPDGRDDGLVWVTPDGPRQTAMLAGRLDDTAPYGWTRNEPSVRTYVAGTIARLRGRGLSDMDMDDLELYVRSLRPPVQQHVAHPTTALVDRGRALFQSARLGCASCHAGPRTTDGVTHDVHTASGEQRHAIATPSLRFVASTAPYFHDGGARTLHDVLTVGETPMNVASRASAPELEALEAYLRSL